jgi:hypothetical protein
MPAAVFARNHFGSNTVWLCRYKLGGVVEKSSPAIYGNRVFFLATDGLLYVLE